MARFLKFIVCMLFSENYQTLILVINMMLMKKLMELTMMTVVIMVIMMIYFMKLMMTMIMIIMVIMVMMYWWNLFYLFIWFADEYICFWNLNIDKPILRESHMSLYRACFNVRRWKFRCDLNTFCSWCADNYLSLNGHTN